jgi:KaiC/GvpD/RAD55 family RecA-like ATPase
MTADSAHLRPGAIPPGGGRDDRAFLVALAREAERNAAAETTAHGVGHVLAAFVKDLQRYRGASVFAPALRNAREALAAFEESFLPGPEEATRLRTHITYLAHQVRTRVPPHLAVIDGTSAPERRDAPPETPPKKEKPFALVAAGDMQATEPDFVIHDLFERDSLALLFGDPGCGKSFLAIELAACVASGADFHGKATKQGPVVYLAGEGHNGIARRVKAWEIAREADLSNKPLFFSKQPARFLDAAHAEIVATAVDEIARKHGAPALIVVDTLARSFDGGDENATKDMSSFIAALDRLRARYAGCTILIVHHSGHGDKSRARGAMALKGALDTEYRVDKRGAAIQVTNTKSKDAPPPPVLTFELRDAPAGTTAEGVAITSATLSRVAPQPAKPEPPPGAKAALSAFAGLDIDADGGVGIERWREAFYAASAAEGQDAKRQAFTRQRAWLVTNGYLIAENDRYFLTEWAV